LIRNKHSNSKEDYLPDDVDEIPVKSVCFQSLIDYEKVLLKSLLFKVLSEYKKDEDESKRKSK
jgi:hypothetical protein